jgi:hypothetical protein
MSDSLRFANDYQNKDQFSPVLIYVALLPIRFKAAATFFYGFFREILSHDARDHHARHRPLYAGAAV